MTLLEGLIIGAVMYLVSKPSKKEETMDRVEQSTQEPNTAVGVAMAKAAADKETVAIAEVETEAELVVYDVDVPTHENPVMYQGVAIYGSQYMSTKFLDIVKHVVMMDEFRREDMVRTIVFCPDKPVDQHGTPLFACYKPPERMVAFNLQQHFDGSAELAKDVAGQFALRGHIWYNMILSLFHEMYHAVLIITDTEPDLEELESTCNDLADEALTALCREFDIEPPPMCDEPFFGTRYMEFYIREIKEGEASWCIRQDALHDGRHIHYNDDRDEYIELFRSFIRYTLGGDPDQKDPVWDAPPKPLNVIVEAAPIVEPVAAQAEVAVGYNPAPWAVAQPDPQLTATGVFHGMDEETAAMMAVDHDYDMGAESNAYTMEDYDMLPPEAAGMSSDAPVTVAQPALPMAVPLATTTTAFCTKCGNSFSTEFAFCGGCGNPKAAAVATVTPQPTYVQPTPTQHVVGTQPMGSQTQTHRGAPGQILPNNLTNHNWEPMAFRAIVEQILFQLYAHLYNKCGYLGGMHNPCFSETGKWGVLERVSVGHIPNVEKVLYAHDFLDEQRIHRTMVPITDGFIRGFCTKQGMLPAYTVYFNANGQVIKRVLLPQNPWKMKAGAYSKPALRAQQGAIIAWMMDGDDNTVKKFRGYIENSVFHWK